MFCSALSFTNGHSAICHVEDHRIILYKTVIAQLRIDPAFAWRLLSAP